MIFITGDTHMPLGMDKLAHRNFPMQAKMTKDDYIIITGDFGGVWDGCKEEVFWLDWLEGQNYTTLFIDGNHENFDMLYAYPLEEWNGGKVRKVRPSILHLARGQVYTLKGLKFFTMGGAYSADKHLRTTGKTWWKEELPNISEMRDGVYNLEDANWEVNYVITHTAPSSTVIEMGYMPRDGDLNEYLEYVKERLTYKEWFFGHFHRDSQYGTETAMYERIINI